MGRTGTEINPDIVVGALNGVSIIMLSTYLVSANLVIPHLLTIYILYNVFILFVPIMGRTGTEINPDIVVGALNGVSIIMLSTYLVSANLVIPHLLTIYILCNVFILFVPIMGRTGTEINPDIVVGALNGVSIIMLSTYLVSANLVIPHLLTIYIYNVFILFVPIMGRTGTDINPDIVVGALNGVSIIMLSTYLVSANLVIPHLLTIYILYNVFICLYQSWGEQEQRLIQI